MKDFQRQKFYDFEALMIKRYLPPNLEDGLSLDESSNLIQTMSQSYKIVPPKVKLGRSKKYAYYQTNSHTIVLPMWAQRTWVVLHEFAHALTPYYAHGPEFVKQWCELWSRYYSIDYHEIIREAKQYGLKVSQ